MKSNIIDIPLNKEQKDLLNIQRYIDGLVKFIKYAEMPTTIAIQGEWGSGKTSLMNQIKSSLTVDSSEIDFSKEFHSIWLNMWEYSLLKNSDDIMHGIIEGLTNEVAKISNYINNKNSENVVEFKNIVCSFLKKGATALAKTTAKVGTNFIANSIGLDGEEIITEFGNNFNAEENREKANTRTPSPKDFRDALEKVAKECLDIERKRGDNKKGFLVFVDDLDRINPVDAVHILELLKNLFEIQGFIFILAIDYEVVVKGLKEKFGAISDTDDRAYRSFFDKIIQLPFSMPVGSYDITNFLHDSLLDINFVTKDEAKYKITIDEEEKNIMDIASDFVYLSTGPNPRSVKRLLNTLSLINMMNDTDELSINQKIINFGFVCLQISYPFIYDLLVRDYDFINWNNVTASNFGIPKLSEEKLEAINSMEEFDEDWEKVVFRACQTSTYLSNRALNVSRLLNLVRKLVPPEELFDVYIGNILGMSSVTTVTSSDVTRQALNKTSRGSLILESIDDLDLESMTSEQRHKVCDFMNSLGSNIETKLISGRTSDYVDFRLKNCRRAFIQIWPRKKGYSFDMLAPDNDVYHNSEKYPEICQAIRDFGYKVFDKSPGRISIGIRDEIAETNAFKFIRLLYKVWEECMDNFKE